MYWSSQAWAFSDGLPSQVPCIPVPAVQVQYHVQAAAQFTKLPSPASVPAGIMLLLLAQTALVVRRRERRLGILSIMQCSTDG